MNQIFGIIVSVIAAGLFFLIGRLVGSAYISFLEGTGGIVTATQIIEAKYIVPVVFAIIAAYAAYKLQTKD
jgi:hypothetical protein